MLSFWRMCERCPEQHPNLVNLVMVEAKTITYATQLLAARQKVLPNVLSEHAAYIENYCLNQAYVSRLY